jgi:hypothetical protein
MKIKRLADKHEETNRQQLCHNIFKENCPENMLTENEQDLILKELGGGAP